MLLMSCLLLLEETAGIVELDLESDSENWLWREEPESSCALLDFFSFLEPKYAEKKCKVKKYILVEILGVIFFLDY